MATVVIIGGGPSGVSAAIYAVRSNMQTLLLYKDDGTMMQVASIENYFGFPEPISGLELLARGRVQAERLGVQLLNTEVIGLGCADKGFTVKTLSGDYKADAVILATGSPRAVPAIPGIRELEGRGVSYCAICDAFFYRNQDVAVLGCGEYAAEEARTLLPIARSVTMLTNGHFVPDGLPKDLQVDTRRITAITGPDKVSAVTFKEGAPLNVSGVFVALGTAGSVDFARKLGAIVDGNHIRVDSKMATNVPGLFAAGDCVGGLLQIVKAVSDGAQAAISAVKFLRTGSV